MGRKFTLAFYQAAMPAAILDVAYKVPVGNCVIRNICTYMSAAGTLVVYVAQGSTFSVSNILYNGSITTSNYNAEMYCLVSTLDVVVRIIPSVIANVRVLLTLEYE